MKSTDLLGKSVWTNKRCVGHWHSQSTTLEHGTQARVKNTMADVAGETRAMIELEDGTSVWLAAKHLSLAQPLIAGK